MSRPRCYARVKTKAGIMLLHDQARWLQNKVVDLFREMADHNFAKHAHADEVVSHATSVNRYHARLVAQNQAMVRLHEIANRPWPEEIPVLVFFDPEKGLPKGTRL